MTRASALRTWGERPRDIAGLIGVEEIPEITVHVERRGHGAARTSGTDVVPLGTLVLETPQRHRRGPARVHPRHLRAPTYDETTSWLIEGLADSAELVARPLDQSLDRAGVVLL
jgi:hypothetical protein